MPSVDLERFWVRPATYHLYDVVSAARCSSSTLRSLPWNKLLSVTEVIELLKVEDAEWKAASNANARGAEEGDPRDSYRNERFLIVGFDQQNHFRY